jgi:hypothetical protein
MDATFDSNELAAGEEPVVNSRKILQSTCSASFWMCRAEGLKPAPLTPPPGHVHIVSHGGKK